ncbi:threonine ammonia-lyase [Marinoscillum furvescens]|uniref:Threonine dehydratase n=1 Tax=Marinoscillum furvescens DSM 4134 TaxID=1122208 RepID=A0A3D9KYY2_MARFU|nr:threonine/serine dehydratase [Marinoscillum furvescens]RED94065.1 threonine dehydratase [Marinoscillum furvescens DSM 4134]
MDTIPSLTNIKRAHQRISKITLDTPVLTSQTINEMAGCEVYFKCENFQKVGSFKMRGAANMILGFRSEERTNGFATHSSGNHAQAVALAAKLAGSKAYVVMPKNSAQVKINATKDYGADVILCEPNEQSRISTCDQVIAETGAIFVHPFDDYRIIAGQATAAKELMEDVPGLHTIMTPVGGGGLAAGTALAAQYIDPNVEVVLGEPKKADDTFKSLQANKIIPVKNPDTIADGLRTSIGARNFEIIQKYVKEVVTVSEKEIIDAMRTIWERMKIIIEPSCAVPFAALLKEKEKYTGKKVGIILTGGNVDLSNLPF